MQLILLIELKRRNGEGFKYIQIGHSLGGFHAHICGYICDLPVIAFDPPGWLESLLHYEGGRINAEKLNRHYSFLSESNPVNQTNTQAGNIFQLPLVSSSIANSGGITAHKIEFILSRISDYSGDPTQDNFNYEPFERVFATPSSRGNVTQQIADTISFRDTLEVVREPDGKLSYEATSRLSNFKYNQFEWVVSHINAGSIWAGHSMIVVEGVKLLETTSETGVTTRKPETFIGYYHLRANTENQAWAVCDEYDFHRYARNYDRTKAKSWRCQRTEVMKMINNVKEQADSGQLFPYSFAGAYSILYTRNGEHNCTSWAMEKLKLAGIIDPVSLLDRVKVKPSPHANNSSTSGCRLM